MRNKTFAAILILPLLAGVLSAESAKTQALLMAMKANGKQMAPYQWKQKVTILRKGNPSGVILEELRFDTTGQLQRNTLAKPEEKRMGPIRAKKAAEIKDSVQEVMQLAGRYASPQQLSQAIQRGEIWEGQGTLRVQARSLILPIDEMTMVVNAATISPLESISRPSTTARGNHNRLPPTAEWTEHDDANDGSNSQGRHHCQRGVIRLRTSGSVQRSLTLDLTRRSTQ